LAVGPIVLAACAAPVELYQSGEGVPGTIAATLGRRSVVIAAPHGTSDARTGDIVAELGTLQIVNEILKRRTVAQAR